VEHCGQVVCETEVDVAPVIRQPVGVASYIYTNTVKMINATVILSQLAYAFSLVFRIVLSARVA